MQEMIYLQIQGDYQEKVLWINILSLHQGNLHVYLCIYIASIAT